MSSGGARLKAWGWTRMHLGGVYRHRRHRHYAPSVWPRFRAPAGFDVVGWNNLGDVSDWIEDMMFHWHVPIAMRFALLELHQRIAEECPQEEEEREALFVCLYSILEEYRPFFESECGGEYA